VKDKMLIFTSAPALKYLTSFLMIHGPNCIMIVVLPADRSLRTLAPKSSHAQIFFKLASQKGNDLPLPKRQKN